MDKEKKRHISEKKFNRTERLMSNLAFKYDNDPEWIIFYHPENKIINAFQYDQFLYWNESLYDDDFEEMDVKYYRKSLKEVFK